VSNEAFGDRMKLYESAEAGRRLMPLLPAFARIDGRGFSRFTRDMARPFDVRLSRLMIDTTRLLVEEGGARVGYTQSDEISLMWDAEHQTFFDGRIQKMTSGELEGRSGKQMQAMLLEKDVNWSDYPSFFKRGTFVQRRTRTLAFTSDEIAALPPKHAARANPALTIERAETVELELPPLGRVTNRVAVLFDAAEPVLQETE